MEIMLNLNGRKRKEAAVCIGNVIGIAPVYRKAPTYAYDIGDLTLDRDGVLYVNDSDETLKEVLSALYNAGFYTPEPESETATSAFENPEHPVIQIPIADFTSTALDNLDKLIASKAMLIKKALDAESLPIERGAEILTFQWLNVNATPEEVTAVTQFVEKLCDMARRQQRVLATEKPVESEKYAFRCFLLRLGFIGEAYAVSRRILLQNLSGNGSRRSESSSRKTESPVAQGQTLDHSECNGTQIVTNVETTPAAKPRFSFRKLFGALKDMALN
ncbi:MAG TPA: virulence protein [Porphyromonadaceae bacterium]|nr:virulence protein [Porphyromonadaceae bacterium]